VLLPSSDELLLLLEEEEEEELPEASSPRAAPPAAAAARSGRVAESTRSSLADILGRPRFACRHACNTGS